jgi:hypothetical protein
MQFQLKFEIYRQMCLYTPQYQILSKSVQWFSNWYIRTRGEKLDESKRHSFETFRYNIAKNENGHPINFKRVINSLW